MDKKRFETRILYIKAVKKSFIKVSSEYGRRYPAFKYAFFALNVVAAVLINLFIELLTFFHRVHTGFVSRRDAFARAVAVFVAATLVVAGVDGIYTSVAYGSGAASGQAVEIEENKVYLF